MNENNEAPFHSGFISIIGRPNVGKSTLLNRLVGEKIAAVSRKPQTTRNRIMGVSTTAHAQRIYVDTPGLHGAHTELNRYMVRQALESLKDVDLVLVLLDARSRELEREAMVWDASGAAGARVIVCPNKVDRVARVTLLPLIEAIARRTGVTEVVPISALTGENVDTLEKLIDGHLPEGPHYFPDDALTDQPERFIAAEFIREKVFILTNQEIPYSTAVVVEGFREEPNRGLVVIDAGILVERDSQKGIIIGRQGRMLKRIGTEARRDIERFLGVRVFLELRVRVEKNWTERAAAMRKLGYS